MKELWRWTDGNGVDSGGLGLPSDTFLEHGVIGRKIKYEKKREENGRMCPVN